MKKLDPAVLFLAVAALWLGGCASGTYIYRPAQPTATMAGLPAARYAIPKDQPTGEIVVASSGATEVKQEGRSVRAIFVRAIVANNSDAAPWMFDPKKQTATIAGQRQSPIAANTYQEGASVVQVPKGERRTVDLYYALPPTVESDDEIPPFELTWTVDTGRGPVAENTSFNRMRIEPAYGGGGPYYQPYGYYGAYGPGWYDPWYRPYGFGVGVGYWGGYPHHHFYGGYGGYGGFRGGGWGGGFGGGGFGGGFRGGGGGGGGRTYTPSRPGVR